MSKVLCFLLLCSFFFRTNFKDIGACLIAGVILLSAWIHADFLQSIAAMDVGFAVTRGGSFTIRM